MGFRSRIGHRVLGVRIPDQTAGEIYEDALPRQKRATTRLVYTGTLNGGSDGSAAGCVRADLAGFRARAVCLGGSENGRLAHHSSGNCHSGTSSGRRPSFTG